MPRQIRIYFPGQVQGERVTLGREEWHYLAHVLRLQPGQEVVLFGQGEVELACEVEGFGEESVVLQVRERLVSRTGPSLPITLAVAVGKGKKLEEIVEATTALGVARIIPFVGDHSVAQRSNPRLAERLHLIAREACRQSRRSTPPEILDVLPGLEQALAALSPGGNGAVFLEERGGRDLLEVALRFRPDEEVAVLIGPEGGWSGRERSLFEGNSVNPLGIGPRVLRTELAAIVAVALIERAVASALLESP